VTDATTPAGDELRPRRRRWLRRTVTGIGFALVVMGLAVLLSPVEDDEGRSCGSSPAILRAFDDDGGRGEPGLAAACRTSAGEQLLGGLIFGTVGAVVVLRGRIRRGRRRAGEELAAERADLLEGEGGQPPPPPPPPRRVRDQRRRERTAPDAFAITAPGGGVVAVVRPVRDDRGVPHLGVAPPWAQGCSVVIGEPDNDASLVLFAHGKLWGLNAPYVEVCAVPGRTVGTVERRGRFSACTCGRRPGRRGCEGCGEQPGRVRIATGSWRTPSQWGWSWRDCIESRHHRGSGKEGHWTVVDGTGVEIASITSEPASQSSSAPLGTPPPPRPGFRVAWAEDGLLRGSIRAARELTASRPIVCSVSVLSQRLDWERWGLVVALAALSDPRVHEHTMPSDRGDGGGGE
jgi:hypothetical protein